MSDVAAVLSLGSPEEGSTSTLTRVIAGRIQCLPGSWTEHPSSPVSTLGLLPHGPLHWATDSMTAVSSQSKRETPQGEAIVLLWPHLRSDILLILHIPLI